MARPMEEPMHDRVLYRLAWLALALSLGHHLDHLIRGNAVGWPVTGQVNAFTISLIVYPIIAPGLVLYRAGRAGLLGAGLGRRGRLCRRGPLRPGRGGAAGADPGRLPAAGAGLAGLWLAGRLFDRAGHHLCVRDPPVGQAP